MGALNSGAVSVKLFLIAEAQRSFLIVTAYTHLSMKVPGPFSRSSPGEGDASISPPNLFIMDDSFA